MSDVTLAGLHEEEILHLAERLDVRGPRYTSYPTAPVWREETGEHSFREALGACVEAGRPVAAYLHLPYCHSRCLYCGCNSFISRDPKRIEGYLAALRAEIDRVAALAGHRLRLGWLHLGGGTPTHLQPGQLAGLLDHMLQRFPADPQAELSVEVDPRITTAEHLELLVERGFRRISIGLQDLDPAVQQAVRREFTFEQMRAFVDLSRRTGFEALNIDLIYGLPLQTRSGWRETLARVSGLQPDRLACFGYAHLPSRIRHQAALNEEDLPGGRDRLGMLLDSFHHFRGQGYTAIGLDHFARPGDRLARAREQGRLWRNFMGYTDIRGLEMIGFGASAISEFRGLFRQNASLPEVYEEAISAGDLAQAREHRLDEDDRLTGRLINELMCNLVIRMPPEASSLPVAARERLAAALDHLSSAEADGLVRKEGDGCWQVSELGQLFLRNLAMPFDRYLPEQQVRYSRTV